MSAYILIIVSMAVNIEMDAKAPGGAITSKWPVVSMERFDDYQACLNAAKRVRQLTGETPSLFGDCVSAGSPVQQPYAPK